MGNGASKEVRTTAVWDLPVRIVHWLLVVLIATSWLTSEIGGNAMTYHMWSGYSILTLVVFRIIWGFVGSQHARFGEFVAGPGPVMRYASALLRSDSPYFTGHNPLGGWSVILLLLSTLLQAVTGLFANDAIVTEGPLAAQVSSETSSLLTTIHYYNFYVVLTLIGLHVAAALFYLLVKRDNLIGAMVTGRKKAPANGNARDARMASVWLAAIILAGVAATVAVVVNWS